MLGLGDDPFKFAAFRVMFRIFFTVFRFTNLTDSFHRTGGCAAGAIVRFRVACISGADAGVRAVTVGRPCAEIVVERLTGFKGRFIGCALGAQTADGARLVVDCFFCAGRGRFQVLFCCCFSREGMRQKVTVLAAAGLADSSVLAVSCAARAVVRFRVACISEADAGMCVIAVGSPCAPVVTEDVARCEGGFIGCALRAQTADGAGFVVDSLCRTGGVGFQIVSFRNLSGEIV